jgi:hypothetical protein
VVRQCDGSTMSVALKDLVGMGRLEGCGSLRLMLVREAMRISRWNEHSRIQKTLLGCWSFRAPAACRAAINLGKHECFWIGIWPGD